MTEKENKTLLKNGKKYYNYDDAYKYYKENLKDYQDASLIDSHAFKRIARAFSAYILERTLEGHEVLLPKRMGVLSVIGRKPKVRIVDGKIVGLAPNWGGTWKLWKENPEAKARKQIVYYDNIHTDGYRYKWNWSRKKVSCEYKTAYFFKVTKPFRTRLFEIAKKEEVDFITK